MPDDAALPDADAREAATIAAVLDGARQRQLAAGLRSPDPPRFLLAGARSMAAHLAMPEERMRECLGAMALWQLHLPAAFDTRVWDFAALREHLPSSYARVRAALAALGSRPQVVTGVFHMPGFPIVCSLIGAAWEELREGPLHLLVARSNMGWLKLGKHRWRPDALRVVGTDPAGLRQLLAGLRTGAIERLVILSDGPQDPASAGTRVLDGVSPSLGIGTGLLGRIEAMGIPLLPITHAWTADRLVVTPHPPLDPATGGGCPFADAVARRVEELLRRHPEQWLNWNAASLRT